MAVHIITSGSEGTIYKLISRNQAVDTDAMSASQEDARLYRAPVVTFEKNIFLHKFSKDNAESLQEQRECATLAAAMAVMSYDQTLTASQDFTTVINLTPVVDGQSTSLTFKGLSSGLSFALSTALEWGKAKGFYPASLAPSVPIFATGVIPDANGYVQRITHLDRKIKHVCAYMASDHAPQSSPSHTPRFYVFYPEGNALSTSELRSSDENLEWAEYEKHVADLGGELHPVKHINDALEILLGKEHFQCGLPPHSSFPGMKAILYDKRDLFKGRNTLIETLKKSAYGAYQSGEVLFISGDSGSGKSSLILGGLSPQLVSPSQELSSSKEQGELSPPTAFSPPLRIKPADYDDLQALVSDLLSTISDNPAKIESWLNQIDQPEAMAQAIADHGESAASTDNQKARPLLWVIDQCEELFTHFDESSSAMAHQLSLLLKALASKINVLIITIIRTEYQTRLPLLRACEATIVSPKQVELEDIIDLQMKSRRLTFESASDTQDGLEAEIVHAAVGMPLTAVSSLLEQMHEHMLDNDPTGQLLTREHYNAAKGVTGVMAFLADKALVQGRNACLERNEHLSEAQLDSIQSSFFELFVGIDQEGDPITQVAAESTINHYQNMGEIWQLIHAFKAHGLLVDYGKGSTPKLKFVHDTLIDHIQEVGVIEEASTQWGSLAVWWKKHKEYLVWRTDNAGNFQRWVRFKSNDPSNDLDDSCYLPINEIDTAQKYQNEELIHHLKWLEYISDSQRANAQKQKKRLRIISITTIIVTLLMVVSIYAGWVAYQKQIQAELSEEEKNTALVEANHNYALALNEKSQQHEGDIAKVYAAYALAYAKPGKQLQESFAILFSQGFELNQLYRFSLSKYKKDVTANVAFSPNGKFIASGSSDKTLYLWELNTGQLRVLGQHNGPVESVAFSPDGKLVVSSSLNYNILRIWNLNTGRSQVLVGHTQSITSLSFSPDGKKIVSGSRDKTLRLWDIETGQSLVLKGHSEGVAAVAFSSDGKTILSGSYDKTLRLWDLSTGQSREIKGHSNDIGSVDFSPNRQLAASGSEDNTLRIWNLNTSRVKELKGHKYNVNSVNFSPYGKSIVSAAGDNTLRLWDIRSSQYQVFKGHTGDVSSAVFSPDGKTIASGSGDKTIRLWNVPIAKYQELSGHEDVVSHIAFSPNSRSIVSSSHDHTLRLWDIATKRYHEFRGHNNKVNSVTFSSDGQLIVSGSDDRTLRLWDINTGQSRVLRGHAGAINDVAISLDGQSIISVSNDRTLRLWNVNTGKFRVFSGHKKNIASVAFSPDGKSIVSGSSSGELYLWNVNTGQYMEFSGNNDTVPDWLLVGHHKAEINSVAFSPDGENILSASSSGNLYLWSVNTRQYRLLKGHTKNVTSIAFSPDGQLIASGSWDDTLRLWDVATGKSQVFKGGLDYITGVAFSPDGKKIIISHGTQVDIFDMFFLQTLQSTAAMKEIANNMAIKLGIKLDGIDLVENLASHLYNQNQIPIEWPRHHPMHWMDKAQNGDSEAMLQLGIIEHRDKNWEKAKVWYKKALNAGHADAENRLNLLRQHMEQ